MTTLVAGLTWCFTDIKIDNQKYPSGIYLTVICVTYRT
jgi:hypothetical protein